MAETIDHLGGTFVQPGFVKKLMEDDEIDELKRIEPEVLEFYGEKAKLRFMALAFLSGARHDTYGDLLTELENDSLKGYDIFPSTVVEAYHMMANYTVKRRQHGFQGKRYMKTPAVGFLQEGSTNGKKAVPGTDGLIHAHIKCFACQKQGHYSNKCPHSMLQHGEPASLKGGDANSESHEDEEVSGSLGFGFMQVCMTQKSRYEGLNQDWILLDTQSNVDIFCNKELLTNVHKIPGPGLHLRYNGGTMVTNMVVDTPNYGTVWYHHRSLANILSFANVRKRFSVTMATGPDDPSCSSKKQRR